MASTEFQQSQSVASLSRLLFQSLRPYGYSALSISYDGDVDDAGDASSADGVGNAGGASGAGGAYDMHTWDQEEAQERLQRLPMVEVAAELEL